LRLDRPWATIGLKLPLDAALPRRRLLLEAESGRIAIVPTIAIWWIFSLHALNTFLLAFGLRLAYRMLRHEKPTHKKME
jgi:hypothetical protein